MKVRNCFTSIDCQKLHKQQLTLNIFSLPHLVSHQSGFLADKAGPEAPSRGYFILGFPFNWWSHPALA